VPAAVTDTHSSELFGKAAVAFVESVGDEPFFAWVAFTAPHDPRQPPTGFRERLAGREPSPPANFLPRHPFDNGELAIRDEKLLGWPRTREAISRELADYYACIEGMDAEIGRILAALEAAGRLDDTIVLFTSDHGLAIGSHGLLGKQNLYEHSMRAPAVIAGPGVTANTTITALGTGTGGTGTYTIGTSQTVTAPAVMYGASTVASKPVWTKGTTLAVSSVASGSLAAGQVIAGPGIPSGTSITAPAAGTSGGAGSYTISSPPAIFTASQTSNYLTVTAMHSGTLSVGQTVTPVGGSPITIVALGTGTGGTGTTTAYYVSDSKTLASTQWISSVGSQGSPITLSSGGGLTGNTTITALLTGTGGPGTTYTVSQPQSVGSQPMFATTLTLPITSTSAPVTTQAPYYSGSGTKTLTFRYVVMTGQTSADLTNNTPIICPAGSCGIVRQSGGGVMSSANGTSLTVAATLLSASSQVVVDTTAPNAPTSVSFGAGGGNVVANTLNASNTMMTVTATITAGQLGSAGYAELLLDGSPRTSLFKTTPGSVSNTATQVTISIPTTDGNGQRIVAPPTDSSGTRTLYVRLYDSASPPNVSAERSITIDVP